MAGRLRLFVPVAALVIALLAAFPHVGATSGVTANRPAVVPVQAPVHGVGVCAPGSERCDPSAPTSSGASPLWMAPAFLAASALVLASFRRARPVRRTSRLAVGARSTVDRPPRPTSFAH